MNPQSTETAAPGLASIAAGPYIALQLRRPGTLSLLRQLAITLSLAFSAPVLASVQPEARPPIQAGAYRIEPSHTKVVFSVAYFPFGAFRGQFVGASGLLQFDPRDVAATKLEVKAPTDSLEMDSRDLTQEIRGPGWFDVAHHAFMTFRSRSVTATGAMSADVAGDLTLRGVTRPVVFKARFTSTGVNPLDKTAATDFEASGVIKRREFGMARYEPIVDDAVRIIITAAIERAPS